MYLYTARKNIVSSIIVMYIALKCNITITNSVFSLTHFLYWLQDIILSLIIIIKMTILLVVKTNNYNSLYTKTTLYVCI
jgi:hypothetical protein